MFKLFVNSVFKLLKLLDNNLYTYTMKYYKPNVDHRFWNPTCLSFYNKPKFSRELCNLMNACLSI